MSIRQLDSVTITKISAGEVIDRPASIVKELIENSLDSGATRLMIDIENGGKTLIRISDNGSGISKEDLPLAPVCHATSKISALEDIYTNLLFGFRGEALASIAHVAKLTITSKTNSQQTGYKIDANETIISTPEPISHPQGTTVEMRELFYNMPVRQKFLKSDTTEWALVYDTVIQALLGNPYVEICLKHNGKERLNTTGIHDLKSLVLLLFGKEYAPHLLPIDLQGNPLGFTGIVTSPAYTLGNRSRQWLFINQRSVRNGLISKAISQTFEDKIPHGRFPLIILNMSLDPGMIDINVHPQKLEIKFLQTQGIFESIRHAIDHALRPFGSPTLSRQSPTPLLHDTYQTTLRQTPPYDVFIDKDPIPHSQEQMPLYPPLELCDRLPAEESNHDIHTPRPTFLQVFNTYLVISTPNGLAILDQHAVHERILYDHIKAQQAQGMIDVQSLLMPHRMALSIHQMAYFESHKDVLNGLGFDIDVFGNQEILIRGIPATLTQVPVEELVSELLTDLQAFEGISIPDGHLEKWKMKACKKAIKAGKRMSESEVNALIEALIKTPDGYTCPHGRPLCVFLGQEKLEKLFLRR